MNFFLALLITTNLPLSTNTTIVEDSIYSLPDVEIIAPVKQQGAFTQQALSASSFSLKQIEQDRINEPKDLSLITPNLFLPDYGSKMTSSIYVRGIGARMEQPSMGLYVDNIPLLNKNSYDFDFYDLRRIEVLRGPQGTLYGRNTIGGVINIYTLSPFQYEGTRAFMGYGNNNTLDFRLSTYQQATEKLAYSIAVNHHSSDGYFTNIYNGEKCDKIISDGLRFRVQGQLSDRLTIDNILSLNKVKQDGFAYALYNEESGKAESVNHNDPCYYDRFGVTNGTSLQLVTPTFNFTSVTSYQYMSDAMTLDQDFLPVSMFTLTQEQKEHAVTQEFVIKSNQEDKKWQWLFGAFGFYKHNNMNAPVTFKQDGINELILANANQGIHTVFPNADLLIEEDNFLIASHFKLPAYGLALFHQSTLQLNKWRFTAGIRGDYEHSRMKYDNYADIHYRFTLTMPEYKLLTTKMNGSEKISFYEILPRVSALYEIDKKNNIYAAVSRGYKTGGFNTQIFSDILQNNMMEGMMDDLGINFNITTVNYDVGSATSYKPEYSWNYEIGSHLNLLNNKLIADIAFFYIDCRNQQLTVFPPGKSTGRLMSNAGKTRSFGAELSLQYIYNNFRLHRSYGYTNAQFMDYADGSVNTAEEAINYKGNYVPYAPQNTIYLSGEYNFNLNNSWLDNILLKIDWNGAGKIYWNESNTLSQPFYSMLNASVWFKKDRYTFTVWGKNLTDTDYHTFYFKSIGNSFVQKGKPVQAGISLNINI